MGAQLIRSKTAAIRDIILTTSSCGWPARSASHPDDRGGSTRLPPRREAYFTWQVVQRALAVLAMTRNGGFTLS